MYSQVPLCYDSILHDTAYNSSMIKNVHASDFEFKKKTTEVFYC